MTYSKICVPYSEPAPKEYQEKRHCPEIVITESTENYNYTAEPRRRKTRRISLPSFSSVLAVCALCLASFIIGCSVTDNALSSAIISIASATYGKVPETTEQINAFDENSGNTFYNKYMTEESFDNRITVDYLSSPLSANNEITASEIPVENSTAGKIGADGEILYPVLSRDLSSPDVLSLSNQTSYKPDTAALLSYTPKSLQKLSVNQNEPLVLILHTHGTECYNACQTDGYYSTNLPVRSENISENVVSMGEKIVSVLENFGIPAIHSTKMCDKDSFVRAYSVSASEAKAYLEKYPSIRFVIDLHRDSIEAADKTKTKPVYTFAGKDTAQLMFVVGTDSAGASHPDWKENLSLALKIQSEISEDHPKLFRRINLRTASFNQQLSPGYMLLECGSCANSYEEAEAAAEIFATGLARVIKKYSA